MTLNNSVQPTIIQASRIHTRSVASFVELAPLLHRNLDWRSLLQWIDQEPFLLKLDQHKIVGLLSCAPDPAGIAWIHCFAVRYRNNYREVWQEMLEVAKANPKIKGCILCSVGLSQWFEDLLNESGFKILQDIVVFYWNGPLPSDLPMPDEIIIRPMESSDIDQVVEVDHQAFAPIWEISQDSFRQVYMQSDHASVAEINGKIIGYELSTANHFSAHLTRLAVSPEFMKANIGYSLVLEMLTFFSKRGIRQISVNTQSNNIASISLYKKLGFKLSNESFPVYSLQL